MAENYPRQNSPDDHFIKVLTQTEVDLGGFIMDQEMDPNLFSPDNANWAPMDDMQQQQQHNFPQGQDNVAMWQTGSSSMYMAQQQQQQQQDSGVHSVSTTQAPSIRSGFEEEMDFPGGISTGPGSVAGASICDMESLPHSEVSSVHSSTMGGTMNSEEAIMKHIPNFIGGLNDDDPTVRDGILQSMERFVKSSKFVQTIVKSPPLMRALIQALSASIDCLAKTTPMDNNTSEMDEAQSKAHKEAHDRTKWASAVLRNVSTLPEGRRIIVEMGGMVGVTTLMNCPFDRLLFNAITTVHNVLLGSNGGSDTKKMHDEEIRLVNAAKDAVRQGNGVEALIKLIQRKEVQVKTIVVDCLRILAVSHEETKHKLFEGQAHQRLADILKEADPSEHKNLILHTVRLLKVLTVSKRNKVAIMQIGGFEALSQQLMVDSDRIKQYCIWTLRNLSDVANEPPCRPHWEHCKEQLFTHLVGLLNYQPEKARSTISSCAAGVLANLTAANEENKLKVFEVKGIPHLIRAVYERGGDREMLDGTLSTLKHITNRHKQAEMAQHAFFRENGLGALIHQLNGHMQNPNPFWPSVKGIVELLKNLAKSPNNHDALGQQNGLSNVCKLLGHLTGNYDLHDASLAADCGSHKVGPAEVAESCLGFLSGMSSNPASHGIMRNVALSLAQVMTRPTSENMQKFGLKCLSDLSRDHASCVDLMGLNGDLRAGFINAVQTLSNSNVEEIAQCARNLMKNLNEAQKFPSNNRMPQQQQQQQNKNNHPQPSNMMQQMPPQQMQSQPMMSGMQQQMPFTGPGPNQGFDGQFGGNPQNQPMQQQLSGNPDDMLDLQELIDSQGNFGGLPPQQQQQHQQPQPPAEYFHKQQQHFPDNMS